MVIYIILSFIITSIAGLSTMIGSLLIFIDFNNKNRVISFSLFFSSCIMLLISILDLIPSSFHYINKIYDIIPSLIIMTVYALFGGILVYVLDFTKKSNDKLYKIGIITFISLILHNIPEGMITFISSSKDIHLGLSLAISISLHNIPEGIAISIPIYYGKNDKKRAILFTLIAALSEPFGALISLLFFKNVNDYMFSLLLSLTAGIMIYLSIFELYKESIKYKKDV